MNSQKVPLVSVVVPNYNHARYLRQRIDSILGQTYEDFELILLDDCSTDNSREILSSYAVHPRVRIEFNAENSGTPFKQWNKGVRMAQGRYVWIAESDDFAESNFLERLVSVLQQQPEATFAYCRAWRVGEAEGGEWRHFADRDLDELDAEHWKRDFVADGAEECGRYFVLCGPVLNASTVVFRKETYQRAGMADERLRVASDYKMWAAMAVAGKVAYIAEPLSYFRTHSENVRTRTDASGLLLSEYFYVMRWIVALVSGPPKADQAELRAEAPERVPAEMEPAERIAAAKRWLSEVSDWNLSNNKHMKQKEMRAYFSDWEFAIVGKEFEIAPPNRWRFFLHRVRFYRRYSGGMDWKQKLLNLLRVFGAPVVGYRSRHQPEHLYRRVVGVIKKTSGYTLPKKASTAKQRFHRDDD
jgi:glycosyltransferase involved in cell wall biosynthesis